MLTPLYKALILCRTTVVCSQRRWKRMMKTLRWDKFINQSDETIQARTSGTNFSRQRNHCAIVTSFLLNKYTHIYIHCILFVVSWLTLFIAWNVRVSWKQKKAINHLWRNLLYLRSTKHNARQRTNVKIIRNETDFSLNQSWFRKQLLLTISLTTPKKPWDE